MARAGSVSSAFSLLIIVIGWGVWWGFKDLRQPDLVVEAKRDECNPQFLQIRVKNRRVEGLANRIALTAMGRDERPVAEQCTFTVDVYCDGRRVFKADKPMPGRWNESPEPVVPISFPFLREPLTRRKFDRQIHGVPSLAHAVTQTPFDIYPGNKEWAGIFIKHEGESECYGFNTGSYFWRDYKYDHYQICKGAFDVTVHIRSGSYTKCEHFTLINKGTTLDKRHFDLERKPRRNRLRRIFDCICEVMRSS